MQATNFLTATETRRQLKDGVITIPQILKDHQSRYQIRNNDVQAWVTSRHSALVQEAEQEGCKTVENGNEQSLLGITIGVKDVMSQCMMAQ
jgi:Asp-tRNA(Asn)/Glu-tRNA(Gln) amidotransferase A subunit family amidase